MEVRGVIAGAHAAPVLCVCWWNGRYFSGAEDGTIRIWDSATLRPADRGVPIRASSAAVVCLEAAPDAKCVFSGSADGLIVCWTWNTGMKQASKVKLLVPVRGMVWDATRQLLVVAGKDSVHVFSVDADTNKLIPSSSAPIKLQRDMLSCIATSNGKVATASFDRSVQLFDPANGRKQMAIRDAHAGGISALCFDRKHETIVTGSYDQHAKIWSRDGTEMHDLRGFPDVVQGIAVNEITGRLWIVANSSSPLVFDPVTGANVTPFVASALLPEKNAEERVFQRAIRFIPETQEMVGLTSLREIVLWRFNNLRPLTSVSLSGSPHAALACCQPTGDVYSAEEDGCVWVWEPTTPNPDEVCLRQRQAGGHGAAVLCMVFDDATSSLITGCEDHTVRIWGQGTILRESDHTQAAASSTAVMDASAGLSVPAVLSEHKERVSAVACAAHNGKHFVISGGWDGFVCVWNAQQAQLIWKGEGSKESHILQIAYSPKENEFAVSTAGEGSIHIWSLEKRRQVKCLVGHEGEVIQVLWNELTGQWVTGSHDHTIRTWNPDGSPAQVIETDGGITAMCADLDTGMLVVASTDHTLMQFDSMQPFSPPVRIGVGHEDNIISIVHVRRKRRYVSTSFDRTLRMWKVPPQLQKP